MDPARAARFKPDGCGPATGSGIPGAHAQVPNSAGHLPSGGAVPNPMIAGNQDLLTGLVSGMRQLQEVLIQKETQQTTTSSDEPETVKPGVSSFQSLKPLIQRPPLLISRIG